MREPHRIAEERSLALHRRVAELVRAEPSLLGPVRARLREAIAAGGRSAPYSRAWLALVDGPMDALVERLVADDDEARALRQSTPFAGLVGPRERWAIWREVYDPDKAAP